MVIEYSNSSKLKLKQLVLYLQDEVRTLGDENLQIKEENLLLQKNLDSLKIDLEQKDLKLMALETAAKSKQKKIIRLETELERKHWEIERYKKNHQQVSLNLTKMEEKCSSYILKYMDVISKKKSTKETQTWSDDSKWKYEVNNLLVQESGPSTSQSSSVSQTLRLIKESFASPEMRKLYAKRAAEKMKNPLLRGHLNLLAKEGVPRTKEAFIKNMEKSTKIEFRYTEILDCWFAIQAEVEKDKELNTTKAIVIKEGKKVEKESVQIKEEDDEENDNEHLKKVEDKKKVKNDEKLKKKELKKRLYDEIMVEFKPRLSAFLSSMQEKVRKEYETKFSHLTKESKDASTSMSGFEEYQKDALLTPLKRKSSNGDENGLLEQRKKKRKDDFFIISNVEIKQEVIEK